MTTLQKMCEQPLTPDRLIPIMLKSAEDWDQVVAFVALTMHHKMEITWELQRRPIATTAQHPMLNLAILPMFAFSNPAMEEEDDPYWSTWETSSSH